MERTKSSIVAPRIPDCFFENKTKKNYLFTSDSRTGKAVTGNDPCFFGPVKKSRKKNKIKDPQDQKSAERDQRRINLPERLLFCGVFPGCSRVSSWPPSFCAKLAISSPTLLATSATKIKKI